LLDAHCGDGNHDVGNEECDDGNLDANDGCDGSCVIEDFWVQAIDNRRNVTVGWSAQTYGATADCQVQIDGMAAGAVVPCTDHQQDVMLPWGDGAIVWNSGVTVEVVPTVVGAMVGTATHTFDCVPSAAASAVPTPTVDEDCDTNWDNAATGYTFGGANFCDLQSTGTSLGNPGSRGSCISACYDYIFNLANHPITGTPNCSYRSNGNCQVGSSVTARNNCDWQWNDDWFWFGSTFSGYR
jgi:cysteine-rich repeat protein